MDKIVSEAKRERTLISVVKFGMQIIFELYREVEIWIGKVFTSNVIHQLF